MKGRAYAYLLQKPRYNKCYLYIHIHIDRQCKTNAAGFYLNSIVPTRTNIRILGKVKDVQYIIWKVVTIFDKVKTSIDDYFPIYLLQYCYTHIFRNKNVHMYVCNYIHISQSILTSVQFLVQKIYVNEICVIYN